MNLMVARAMLFRNSTDLNNAQLSWLPRFLYRSRRESYGRR